jgi:hypothetical protein
MMGIGETGAEAPVDYRQWMIAKFRTIASDKLPALMFRTVMVQEPVLLLEIQQLYAPAVAPDATLMIVTSLTPIKLLFSVNVTLVVAFNVALFSVICPADLLSVTAVLLLVACVTTPCAAAA